MPASPIRIDESEDCAELDADYFQTIGSTFDVVDAWDENDEVQIKTEPDDESNHSKASSKKSNNKDPETNRKTSSRHDSRSNTRPERSRVSPVRRRSPDRKRLSLERGRNRFSPRRSPERNRTFRDDRFRRSPPRNVGQFDRRRPPSQDRSRHQPPQSKKSFLEEMQEQFIKEGRRDEQIDQMLQQGGRIDLNIADLMPEPPRNFQNLQMHFNNQPNQMPGFMNEPIMPQHFNPMMMHQMPPTMMNMPNMQFPPNMHAVTSPTIPTNIFMNPLEIMQPAPLPVPPPQQMEPARVPGTEAMQFPQISPPILYHNNNNGMPKQPVTIVRENVERPQTKKTPNEPAKNLIDILRQKSKQNTKTSEEEIASRKAKVLERCRSAVDLITNLEKNKSKVPLTCVLPSQTIHKPNITVNKSPLLTSESNPRYMFQATPDQCFSVLENHPVKNIYGEIGEIAQYLKLDMHELSSIVARESIIRPPALSVEPQVTTAPVIIKDVSNIFSGKKTSTKEVQTGPLTCKRCTQMDMIKQSAKSQACQTTEDISISTEVKNDNQDETDGFRFFIDAQTLANRNFEQHHALEVFSRAFGIDCPFIDRNREHELIEERPQIPIEETDERWSYTNPENPNQRPEIDNFFSTSPIQKRQTEPMSFKTSNSPPRFRTSISPTRRPNSPSRRPISPTRRPNSPNWRPNSPNWRPNSPTRRLNSPLHHRNSNLSPRFRQNRSVFERIGEKIPDNADSPRNYEDWNDDEFNNRGAFRPYTIPSPRYVAPRERSPEPSRRYRNRSRSRSASRSLSRSPKRYRGGNKILSRRGRY